MRVIALVLLTAAATLETACAAGAACSAHFQHSVNGSCLHVESGVQLTRCQAMEKCASMRAVLVSHWDLLVSLMKVAGAKFVGKKFHTGLDMIQMKAQSVLTHLKWSGDPFLWISIADKGNVTHRAGKAIVVVEVGQDARMRTAIEPASGTFWYICERVESSSELGQRISLTEVPNLGQFNLHLLNWSVSCSESVSVAKRSCVSECFLSRKCLRISVDRGGTCSMHMDVSNVPEEREASWDMYAMAAVSETQ